MVAGWGISRTNAVSPGLSQPASTGTTLEQVREAVATKVRPTVVEVIVALLNGKKALGSGVVIDPRGYIVTNNHVVSGARTVQVVLYDGTNMPASIAGTDPPDDLAVLKIHPPTGNLTVVTLGDSSKLRVGQEVLAIGNPLGITETVTHGIVSALGRTVSEGQGGAVIRNAIQTDAPINPGNSGGALIDLQGNLVGIPTLTAIDPEFNTPANGVGFAIPSNRVRVIVPEIIQKGKATG
jgi:S1-C subfamily serine protease